MLFRSVLADAVGVGEEPAHRELARVVEVNSRRLLEHCVPERVGHLFSSRFEYRLLSGLKHGIETAHDREGQDDVTILMLFEAGAQEVRSAPNKT